MNALEAIDRFSYDPDSGVITRNRNGRVMISRTSKGYIQVSAGRGVNILAHRLAWLIYYGEWPEDQIDHIDGCRSNNSILNLREADNGVNGRNKKVNSRAKRDQDLPIGIRRRVCRGRLYFVASCQWFGKPRYKLCPSIDSAVAARESMKLDILSQPNK